mmetsp:Transcript_59705/g.158902  ORF Transcript_59705/g.158902 Transcript_59705/m.158902 type:complete len:224 (-) Transcript_59705:1265-1936(-)
MSRQSVVSVFREHPLPELRVVHAAEHQRALRVLRHQAARLLSHALAQASSASLQIVAWRILLSCTGRVLGISMTRVGIHQHGARKGEAKLNERLVLLGTLHEATYRDLVTSVQRSLLARLLEGCAIDGDSIAAKLGQEERTRNKICALFCTDWRLLGPHLKVLARDNAAHAAVGDDSVEEILLEESADALGRQQRPTLLVPMHQRALLAWQAAHINAIGVGTF